MKKITVTAMLMLASGLMVAQGINGNKGGAGQPGTAVNPDPEYYVDQLFVNEQIKVGTNSLYLSSTNAGVDNSIYTDNGDLRINGAEGQGPVFNTLINSEGGRVGIGLSDPGAKLDINIGAYNLLDAGVRITTPIQKNGTEDPNKNIFLIQKEGTANYGGGTITAMRSQFVVKDDGRVGIGTGTPDAGTKLHVHNGILKLTGANGAGGPMMILGGTSTIAPYGQWGIEYNEAGGQSGLNFWKPYASNNYGNYYLFLADNGNVGVGTNTPEAKFHVPTGNVFIGDVDLTNCTNCGDYRLFVRGGIRTEEVKVDLAPGIWADYVFGKHYKLNSLDEVEDFINENHHLPNMPSAEDVESNGVNLARMDAKLLEKIEELTLYVIDLQKQNKQLQEQVNELKK